MQRSLTVLLPVHNAQSTLTTTVAEVLEVVCELTEKFELLIVDDGSSDATGEIAHELTGRYPQIRTVYHGKHLGREAAVQTGLDHSTGEIVFLRNEDSAPSADDIPHLWQAAFEHPTVADRREMSKGPKWKRLDIGQPERGAPEEPPPDTGNCTPHAGYQMIDRRIAASAHATSQPVRPNFMGRIKDFALGE